MSAVDAAGNVWLKYRMRLTAIEVRLANDALFDPKSEPDRTLVEERWRLQEKMRMAEKLAEVFSEEGL